MMPRDTTVKHVKGVLRHISTWTESLFQCCEHALCTSVHVFGVGDVFSRDVYYEWYICVFVHAQSDGILHVRNKWVLHLQSSLPIALPQTTFKTRC